VTADFGTISGGFANFVGGFESNVAGGEANSASGSISAVGGGINNGASGDRSVVSGGENNSAGGPWSGVASGINNTASDSWSSVAGGADNTAGGPWSSIAGGNSNNAGGSGSSIAGGTFNNASGRDSIVVGGNSNNAGGSYSFAAGHHADAAHNGTFVWADSKPFTFSSLRPDEFAVRATGGVRFVTAVNGSGTPTAGVVLAPGGGSWASLSDRTLKRDFAAVDGSWLLGQIAALPISTWGYKAQKPSIRHLGPTAQDFARAFGLGESKRRIDSIDSEGVSLAGIQALDKLVRAQQGQLRAQRRELDVLKAQVAKLQRSR
jgi:hypothetical protein